MTDLDMFTKLRLKGIAYHGNTPFDMPVVTQIDGNLWQGGSAYEVASDLPEYFEHVLNLYPSGPYGYPTTKTEMRAHRLLDGFQVPDPALLEELAAWVNEKRALGPTLVHCQVGLNRSSLVTALALIRSGVAPADAISLLREKRSPAVLCNKVFEEWLLAR